MNCDMLAANGFTVCALTPSAECRRHRRRYAVTEKMAIVIGSERAGLSLESSRRQHPSSADPDGPWDRFAQRCCGHRGGLLRVAPATFRLTWPG